MELKQAYQAYNSSLRTMHSSEVSDTCIKLSGHRNNLWIDSLTGKGSISIAALLRVERRRGGVDLNGSAKCRRKAIKNGHFVVLNLVLEGNERK